MTDYTKATNFATKDSLPPGSALKIVRGTEIDTEFNAIATAVATKTDNAAAAITGGTITGITDLAVADGGTGSSTASGARTNLGLVIGTNVQAWDADLDTWAGKTAPSGTVVGTTDTQTLSNKTVSGDLNMASGSKYQVGGVATNALAWGNFYYTGSVMSTRASYNVSSITRNGTGDYTINYTNAFADSNYAWLGSTNQNAAGNAAGISVGYQDNSSNVLYSTTQTRILVKFGSGSTVYDPPSVTFAVFGN